MLLEMPQWVQVWFWLRFLREPRDLAPLPHQGINPEAMTMERYEKFEAEWMNSGAPKVSTEEVVMAMTGDSFIHDDEIPF
jgi:hypothetical protein